MSLIAVNKTRSKPGLARLCGIGELQREGQGERNASNDASLVVVQGTNPLVEFQQPKCWPWLSGGHAHAHPIRAGLVDGFPKGELKSPLGHGVVRGSRNAPLTGDASARRCE